MDGLYISPQTRAQYAPAPGLLNISMDFNAAPSGTARGTEVIIPDNASPQVRAAAEAYNREVAEFARRYGINDYPIRGVRTTSENERGVPHTVHVEPFFNSDIAMQRAIQQNPAEFAEIYRRSFGGLQNARLIAPHGVGADRGAASEIFGDETSYGELMANALLGNPVQAPQISGGAGQAQVIGQAANDTLSGGQQMAPQAQYTPPEREDTSIWRNTPFLSDADRRARLAIGLEGMTLNPNQQYIQSLQGEVEARREQAQLNETAAWLQSQPGGGQFAQALLSGIPADQVFGAYMQSIAPQSGPEPIVVNGQLVNPATGQVIGDYRTPELPEAGFVQLSQDEITAAGLDPSKAYQRGPDGRISEIGGSGVSLSVITGPQQTAGWEAIDKAYAETWLRDSVSGLPDVANQAAQISGVLAELEGGAELTGPMIGVQGDFIRALTNPEAQDAKDRVEQVVQRSLKETLGAQFTQAESDRLIARAYNINLPPEQNAARLRALFTTLEAVATQKMAMREYFNENGTLQGFSGSTNIPTVDDFLAVMDQAAQSPSNGQEGSPEVGDAFDFTNYGQAELMDFDLGTASPQQVEAWLKRAQELGMQ